jgi:hypothetical protein
VAKVITKPAKASGVPSSVNSKVRESDLPSGDPPVGKLVEEELHALRLEAAGGGGQERLVLS